ncbi:Predicted P-loop ATPase [Fusobacterium necrogenes]|uniref:Predicted P-loop ATPase n=1 Tax=Fusobacterium necrogenes TaxID=858 RepID=A0A377GWK5_9FUSO|nr:P-loop NTPase fold protein [Fusobacterium necrogenes]STO31223.1 Predicted P-loop ATPase [Fusobacterium necrogenes]
MKHYEKLTKKRKAFIEQLYNLINTQFEEQEKLVELESLKKVKKQKDKIKLIIEELENNSDHIQRIFIDAPWGMGKSFFSKALKEKIEKENVIRGEEIKLININAWETDYFSDPMKSLIGEIDEAIGLSNTIKEEAKNLFSRGIQTLKKIGWDEAVNFIGEIGLNKILNTVGISEEKRKEIIDTFNETKDINTDELKEYQRYKKLVSNFKIALSKNKKLKVIVIDELDRCKPTYAIELLETIKHFFGVKNIIFVFLVNKKQLQSIISTSYLQDDECSEYFEKFFDIQFNLPELEYEDFIQIEYDKYNQPQTYEVNNEGISEDDIRIYESIFLDAFSSNCDSSVVSPRNFIKSFKKFRILLASLEKWEKGSYPLMIMLILYFIKEEFFNKIKNDGKNVENKNDNNGDISIALLCFKTFFEYLNGEKIGKEQLNLGNIISSYQGYKIKDKYFADIYYKILLQVLFFETGEIRKRKDISHLLNYLTLGESVNIYNDLRIEIKIDNKRIVFNEIYLGIYPQDFMSNEFKNVGYIKIIKKSFSEKELKKYYLTERGNSYYSTALLEAWAEQKYNFTTNIK